jgi:hypothetical protein
MGRATSGHMMEARHGVMLLGEEFGVHLPRALTSFIASIGPVGAAMEAAFPFLAIAVGATLLIEHLAKMHEAGEKLTDDQVHFGTAVQNAFNQLDQKLIQAQIKADELRKDHLGAVKDELTLIDMQSMEELVHSFSEVSKAADVVFADMKSHWYTFGIGSVGAKHALDEFQTKYDSMLAQGKDADASGLLAGTLKQAKLILDAQQKMKAGVDTSSTNHSGETAQYNAAAAAHVELQKAGVGWTDKEITSQQALVDALNAQLTIEQKVATLKSVQSQNVVRSEGNKGNKEAEQAAKKALEAAKKVGEELFKQAAEQYKRNVEALQNSERDKLDITERGSQERLQAIDAAIKEEESAGLTSNSYYRSLLAERVAILKQERDEENKLHSEAGKEDADNTLKMGELSLAAFRAHQALLDSARKLTADQRLAEEIEAADWAYALKQAEFGREALLLETTSKDYENKLKAIQDKEAQNAQAHENQIKGIKAKAAQESIDAVHAALQKAEQMTANGLAQSIMGHQTWAKMLSSLGNQVVSDMIKNSLMIMMQQDKERFSNARTAATNAFEAGTKYGGPLAPMIGAAYAAATFAAVMAFEGGGVVPGVGRGDIVPSMLTPGEGIVPGGVMDGLSKMAREGGFQGGGTHYTIHAPIHMSASVMDAEGVDKVFTEHSARIQKHFENTIRKMNR